MIITIKVHTCTDRSANTEAPPRHDLVVVYGYLPSGQLLIQSGRPVAGADYQRAIRSLIDWIFKNRPGWSFLIDDARMTHVEMVTS